MVSEQLNSKSEDDLKKSPEDRPIMTFQAPKKYTSQVTALLKQKIHPLKAHLSLQKEAKKLAWDPKSAPSNYEEIIEQPFGHGSNSASLIGVVREGGLVPTGSLLQQNKPLFSGELEDGISTNGVNMNGVSLADRRFQLSRETDIQYATGENLPEEINTKRWTPSKAHKKIKKLTQEIAQIQEAINQSQNGMTTYKGSQRPTHIIQEILLAPSINQKKIEETRVQEYKKLTKQEKKFIKTPFPVIYRVGQEVEDHPKYIRHSGTWGGEVSVGDEIALGSDIKCLLVPEKKVGLTRAYLQSKGYPNLNVFPLEMALPQESTDQTSSAPGSFFPPTSQSLDTPPYHPSH